MRTQLKRGHCYYAQQCKTRNQSLFRRSLVWTPILNIEMDESRDLNSEQISSKRVDNSSQPSSSGRDGRKKQDDCIDIFKELFIQLSNVSKEQWLASQECQQAKKNNICPGDQALIPYFDPATDNITVIQWTKDVDELAKKFCWDECSILRLIVPRLKGNARKWYDTRCCVAGSWSEIKSSMIKTFNKPLPFAKLIKEAILYETKPGQNLGDYIIVWKKYASGGN